MGGVVRSILGIDPGKTTGLALVNDPIYDNPDARLQIAFTAQITPREEMYSWLMKVLATMMPDVIACESFIITQATARHSRQYDALYVIGATEMMAQTLGIPFELRQASIKKAWANPRMDECGFNVRGGHAKDAARHALFAFQERGRVPPVESDGSTDQDAT